MSGDLSIGPVEQLTERELEILQLIAAGLSNREIAESLVLSLNTIKWYNNQIYSKLGVTSRTQALAVAQQRGLIAMPDMDLPTSPVHALLPSQANPFVGREAELNELDRLLADPKVTLVTVLGLGGMGKTSLTLEAARRQLGRFNYRVYFIALAPLNTGEQLLLALADQVGFQFRQGHDPLQQLLAYFHNKQALLVLDNFEHLQSAAPLVAALLQAAPGVKILVTSRERLHLSAETLFFVDGLAVPDDASSLNVLDYSALALFVQTAQRVDSRFTVDAQNLDQIARICRLLGAMPLGILLAASWVTLLSLEQIADEIQHSLDILESETRDTPPRHRSIRAVFEQSWAMLSVEEQVIFQRLALFLGGFCREAAAAVAGAGLRSLRSLLDKSLIQPATDEHFTMHELLRQFGLEKLQASPEYGDLRQAQTDYFAGFMHRQWQRATDHEQIEALQDIHRNFDNLRAAWLEAAQQRQLDSLRKMDKALFFYLRMRARYLDGIELFQQAVTYLTSEDPGLQVDIVRSRLEGHLNVFHDFVGESYGHSRAFLEDSVAFLRGTQDSESLLLAINNLAAVVGYIDGWPEVQAVCEEGLKIAEATGDRWSAARFQKFIGTSYRNLGRYDLAKDYGEAAMHIAEAMGDLYTMGGVLSDILGESAMLTEEYESAEVFVLRGLALYRMLNYTAGMSMAYSRLGRIAIARQDLDTADRWFRQSLQLNYDSGCPREQLFDLFGIARVYLERASHQDSLELLALVLAHPLGNAPWLQEEGAALLKSLETALPTETFSAAVARGQAMTLDIAVTAILDQSAASKSD